MDRRRETFEALKGANPVPSHHDPSPDHPPIRRPIPRSVLILVLAVSALTAVGLFLSPFVPPDAPPATSPESVAPPTTPTDSVAPPELHAPEPSQFVLSDGTVIATTQAGSIERVSSQVSDAVLALALDELRNHPALGSSLIERDTMLFGCPNGSGECESPLGGLTITLTIDAAAQAEATNVYEVWNAPMTRDILVVDNATGAIRAHIGGLEPLPADSLAHLVIATSALESGLELDSEWDITPRSFANEDGTTFECANSGGGGTGRSLDLALSIVNEVNVTHCDIAQTVGTDALGQTARRLGFPEGSDIESFALGGLPLSPIQAAQGFATIANFGTGVTPHAVANVTSPRADVVWTPPEPQPGAVDPNVAATLHSVLHVIPVRGTAPRAAIDSPQGGMTASTETFERAWFAGYTPELTAIVRVSGNDGSPLVDIPIRGEVYLRVFGGSVPAPMWKDLMVNLVDPSAQFPPYPAGSEIYIDTP